MVCRGIGANQIIVNEWAIAAGGHTRAGLEDNVRLDKNTLAPSNAALIQSCLLYTSPSPRDRTRSRMPSSA